MPAFQRNSMIIACLLLLAGIFCSAWFRFHVANSDPLWLDELHSVWAINRPIDQVEDAAALGNQAPLYFWILKFSHESSGNPIGFRWLSLACSVLTTASVGGFVWYWSRSFFAASLTVWLCAIDPNMIFYGSEARPYALLMLIAVWQSFAFARCGIAQRSIVDSPNRKFGFPDSLNKGWLAATIVLSAILLLVHYTGILLLATECLVVMGIGVWHGKHLRWILIAMSLIGTAFIVFAISFDSLHTIADRRTQWNGISSPMGLLTAYVPQLACLGAIPLGILCFTKWMKKPVNKDIVPIMGHVLAWVITPAMLAALCDWLGLAPLAMFRYTVVGAVAMPIFAGLCIGAINEGIIQVICIPTILAISIFAPIPERNNERWLTRPANEFAVRETTHLFTGEPIRMRFESWDSAINLFAQTGEDIYLFANLLEDQSIGQRKQTLRELDYLKFPLTFSKIIRADLVIPKPSQHPAPFKQDEFVQRWHEGPASFWVVIRGDDAMANRIKSNLAQVTSNIKVTEFVHESMAPEWLTVLKISLDEQR